LLDFLSELYYDARIHEYQVLFISHTIDLTDRLQPSPAPNCKTSR